MPLWKPYDSSCSTPRSPTSTIAGPTASPARSRRRCSCSASSSRPTALGAFRHLRLESRRAAAAPEGGEAQAIRAPAERGMLEERLRLEALTRKHGLRRTRRLPSDETDPKQFACDAGRCRSRLRPSQALRLWQQVTLVRGARRRARPHHAPDGDPVDDLSGSAAAHGARARREARRHQAGDHPRARHHGRAEAGVAPSRRARPRNVLVKRTVEGALFVERLGDVIIAKGAGTAADEPASTAASMLPAGSGR